jgi:lauroyl/myristoyl acyltransferase
VRPGLDLARARAFVRYDGAWWRRIAELSAVRGPEWVRRAGPPVVAAILYALANDRRPPVLRNQRQVRGPRGRLREHWDAYRVFTEFAHSLVEAYEQWGPRPRPIDLTVRDADVFEAALAERRGLVAVTGHFGSWEVGARGLARFGRPLTMVAAQEPNPSVRASVHALRTRWGINVVYSDRSHLSGLPILQALRRDEIVAMHIEPWGALTGSHEVEFCGRRARFQLGPFALARVARAPLVAVFALRNGVRRYELRVAGRYDPRTPADSVAALTATVRAYEQLVRERPAQWLMFDDVWKRTGTPREDGLGEVVHEAASRAPNATATADRDRPARA